MVVKYLNCIVSAVFLSYLEAGSLIDQFQDTSVKMPHHLPKNHKSSYPDATLTSAKSEDVHLNIMELIRKYGYPVQQYDVITKDGYILRMFRIPSSGRPVLLMHGLVMSADDFVTPGPGTGLAYLLAAEGYDVWLGNKRGTKHSRRHVSLSPNSTRFWDFSWEEMGLYDLPAMIDFVLDATGEFQLVYIGFSQGTTAFFVMASEKPEYNHKISLMVGLAPAGAVTNVRSPFLRLMMYGSLWHPSVLFSLMRQAGIKEFLPQDGLVQLLSSMMCGDSELAKIACRNMLFLVSGLNTTRLDATALPVIFSHAPSSTSTKQLEHYAQTVTLRSFRRFDYGEKKNERLYGSKIPPEFPLEAITTPLILFYSKNDWLASETDTIALRNRLKTVVEFYPIPYKNFSHLEFMYAKDLKTIVFEPLLERLKQHFLYLPV